MIWISGLIFAFIFFSGNANASNPVTKKRKISEEIWKRIYDVEHHGADASLLEKKIEISNTPPLHVSVKNNWQEYVEELLKKGADPNLKVENGSTALESVVDVDIAKALIKYGADIKQCAASPMKNILYSRLLFFEEKKELFEYLLSQGADPNKDWFCSHPLYYLICADKVERYFHAPLHTQNQISSLANLFISYGSDPNMPITVNLYGNQERDNFRACTVYEKYKECGEFYFDSAKNARKKYLEKEYLKNFWNKSRIIWIAKYKEQGEKCYLKKLPIELLRFMQELIEQDFTDLIKKEGVQ